MFYFHIEIFKGFPSNNWYTIKELGEPPDCVERTLCSLVCSSILFMLILGPLLLFAEGNKFLVADNPVLFG